MNVESASKDFGSESMLLVLPLPFVTDDGVVEIETQAANGVRQWLQHFSSLTIAAPYLSKEDSTSEQVSTQLIPIPL